MVLHRQNSEVSSIASERILAVVPGKEVGPRAPVDLEDADRHEQKIAEAVQTLKGQLSAFLAASPRDQAQWTPEQQATAARLKKGMEQIRGHQMKLREDMVYARNERRKLQADQRKAAMVVQKTKAAPPVRMEELRALNVKKLDESDERARWEMAQKPKPIVPSGGFTGFRVAPDLKRMDFSHSDPNHPDKIESWRPEVQNKSRMK